MTETQETQAPDEAAQWYAERTADNLRQVESQLNDLASYHSQLESSYDALDKRQKEATAVIDVDTALEIERQRKRMEDEGKLVADRYGALLAQKQHLETNPSPRFEELMAATKDDAGQLFLSVHKAKLANDPAAMKNLMFAHSRAAAYGIRPGSNAYYKALEASMGWDESDRSAESLLDESAEQRAARTATKREPQAQEFKPTPEQVEFSKSINGIDSAEYLKACAKPFSQASEAVQHAEPASFDSNTSRPMEINFEPEPAKKTIDPARYKPDPKTSVTLSKAEVELCKHMAVSTDRPEKDVLKEFAANKIALHSKQSGHYQLYADKLASEGHH